MKTKISAGFQICISAPLKVIKNTLPNISGNPESLKNLGVRKLFN